MGILEDIMAMQEAISKLPPQPKEIRMGRAMYYAVESKIAVEKHIAGIPPELNPYHFLPRLWLEDDFSDWTEAEKVKGYKLVY